MGELQSSLWVPELRHYECTRIRPQGLTGDDGCRVGEVCQPTLRCPGRRLPDRSVKGEEDGGEKMQTFCRRRRGCILHWLKQQTFLTALANISGSYERGRDIMCQYNIRTGERGKKRKRDKNISVTFCILTSVLSVGQPGVQYLPSCVTNYLWRNWLKNKQTKKPTLLMKPHKTNDMPCRPSFIGSSFDFLKLDLGAQCIYLCSF